MRESSIPILEGGSPNHLSTEEIEDNRYFLYVQVFNGTKSGGNARLGG